MSSAQHLPDKSDLKQQIHQELTQNILPFWMDRTVDKINGGFYGALTNDLTVHNDQPRSAILCARILWTYARAHRQLGGGQYLSMARRAYDYLTRVFMDPQHGGSTGRWTIRASCSMAANTIMRRHSQSTA
jgi:mannobiose 2-epimerase